MYYYNGDLIPNFVEDLRLPGSNIVHIANKECYKTEPHNFYKFVFSDKNIEDHYLNSYLENLDYKIKIKY